MNILRAKNTHKNKKLEGRKSSHTRVSNIVTITIMIKISKSVSPLDLR